MNITPMIALLKKDFHLYRIPIFGGAGLIAMPYIMGFSVCKITHLPFTQFERRTCAQTSVAIMYAMAAVFGAAAFAIERRERWADFLAMMPTTRFQSVLSKTIICIAFLVPIWAINVRIAFPVPSYTETLGEALAYRVEYALLLHAMVWMFAVAWLISSFQSSAAFAACTSIGSIAALFLLDFLVVEVTIHSNFLLFDLTMQEIEYRLFGLAGPMIFLAGSIYYLRRIEP